MRGLGSRPSSTVLVDVTSLPIIGEGFEVSSTIFYGHVMLLLTVILSSGCEVAKVAGKGGYNDWQRWPGILHHE